MIRTVSSSWETVFKWILDHPYARSTQGQQCLRFLRTVRSLSVGSWDHIHTAAIEQQSGGDHVIRIDQTFHEQYLDVETPQRKINTAFVLLHEANHLRRSDLTRFVPDLNLSWSNLSNVVTDVIVNAGLFQHGFSTDETITQQLYDVEGIQFLLIPPHQLIRRRFLDEGAVDVLRPYREMPERLWADVSRPSKKEFLEEALTNVVRPWVKEKVIEDIPWRTTNITKAPFDRLFDGYLRSWFGDCATDELARLLDELLRPMPALKALGSAHGPRGVKGRGLGETTDLNTRRRRSQRVTWFANVVEKALVEGARSSRPVRKQTTQRGVIPSTDRSSSFLLSKGTWPVFFDNELEDKRITDESAHLYIDSSGSMSDEIVDLISELVMGADGLITEPIHLFTTEVTDVSLDELKDGKRVNGGTKINAPLTHARENQLNKFIIMTDGHVEEVNSANESFLRKSEMYVIYENEPNDDLNRHAEKYWGKISQYLESGNGKRNIFSQGL